MKIVVCIKQVPASNDAKIDPETKRIIRDAVKSIMNPF
jgi:electron transfer flavoprotein beta subunit